MRVNFQLFDLAVDKIKNPIAYYVDLLEDRLVYHLEAEVDKEPNIEAEEYSGQENVYLCETRIYRRSQIVGVSMTYTKPYEEELYVILIEIEGASDCIEITFNSRKAAYKFHKQLVDYIFPKKEVSETPKEKK